MNLRHAVARYYDLFMEQQGGTCAICDQLPTNRRLSLDHNHETGDIRGLLCIRCNVTLGYIEGWQKATGQSIAVFLDYLAKEPSGIRVGPGAIIKSSSAIRREAMAQAVRKTAFETKKPMRELTRIVAKEFDCHHATVLRAVRRFDPDLYFNYR